MILTPYVDNKLARVVQNSIVVLACFFSFWVLIYPATWLVGNPGIPGHIPKAPVFVAANPDSISRFSDLPLVRLLHCGLGALWTVTAPIQFNTNIRRQHPGFHKICGRLFFLGATAIMAGYLMMEHLLVSEHGVHLHTFYRPLAAWFSYTAVRAVVSATVQRDYVTHGKYCIRHMGAGLTFALARLMVLLVGALLHFSGTVDMAVTANKLTAFYCCSYTAAVLCVVGCESLAQQLDRRKSREKPCAPSTMATIKTGQ